MLLDWLGREGGAILGWWLLSLLAGIAAFPLFFRLMNALPSRGYTLARLGGIMLIGFVFWLMNILGLLQNTPGGILLATLIVFFAGVISYATWTEREPILPYLRQQWVHILAAEVLFAVMFFGWAYVRSINPELVSTEKPMEMAFLSASRRSATFPPHDPWMSGYAISYYHFGYILMSMFANLTGVPNGMAFNLGIALLFALTGFGAFGVTYDMVVGRIRHRATRQAVENDDPVATPQPRHYPGAILIGILAAVFVVVMGNLGTGILEVPYQLCKASSDYLRFMDIGERGSYRSDDPANCGSSLSTNAALWSRANFWWWFRYSRVVQDRNLDGSEIGAPPITEFPQFSFILSDMHPHVLALPFATLIVGLALSLVMRQTPLQAWEVLLYTIFTGGMIFLNTWDAAYFGLIIGAEALRRLLNNGTGRFVRSDWFGILRFAIALIGLTAILYAPFFISFRSQAEGIAPNIIWPTRFQQLYLIFGTFITIIFIYLLVEIRRARNTFNASFGLLVIASIAILSIAVILILGFVAWEKPELRGAVFQMVDESGGFPGTLGKVFERRLEGLVTEFALLFILFAVIGRLFARAPYRPDGEPDHRDQVITYSPAAGFALLLIAAGATLILLPEFAYLRDNFGVRMNTVFKLYYQAWVLWSIASAYGLWSIVFDWNEIPLGERRFAPIPVRVIAVIAAIVLTSLGLIYPVQAVQSHYLAENGKLSVEEVPEGWQVLVQDKQQVAAGDALAQKPDSTDTINAKMTGTVYINRQTLSIYPEQFEEIPEDWQLMVENRQEVVAGQILAQQVNTDDKSAMTINAKITGKVNVNGRKLSIFVPLSLDGSPTIAVGDEDYQAITCLMRIAQSDKDVVVEGHEPSAAYNHEFGRVSALSGIPTILGWQNHEAQWRGASYTDAAQGRAEAVTRLYNSTNWSDVLDVVRKYGITYIFIGPTERRLYTEPGLAKFDGLKPVCQSGSVAVYSTDGIGLQVPAGR